MMNSSSSRPSLTAYVTVKPITSSKHTFTSQSLWIPCGARGVFGGQVIAQSLTSAGHTIPSNLGLHSQHCYFLLPALSDPPIRYRVRKLRDGKSYATRLVTASQKDQVVFVLIASYTVPPQDLRSLPGGSSTPFSFTPHLDYGSDGGGGEWKTKQQVVKAAPKINLSHSLRFAVEETISEKSKGKNPAGVDRLMDRDETRRKVEQSIIPPFSTHYQLAFPDGLLPFEECEEEHVRWSRFLESDQKNMSTARKASIQEYIQERIESPVGISVARRNKGAAPQSPHVRMIWTRARLNPGEKPSLEVTKAMVAYMSDFQFIGTSARSVGLTWTSQPRLGMLASLDHSTHFYPFPSDLSPDEPLLHVMESVVADVGAGRGLVRGAVFTRKGVLIASTSQEGVVRADLKGMSKDTKGKGLIEGGGVGDVADARAKL